MENKVRKINLVMNELNLDENDPTKVKFSMIILDGEKSHNNVKVGTNGLNSLAKSVKGMPLVAKMIINEDDRSKDDFGDHEVSIGKDRNNNDVLKRDTIAIGAFTSEGYISKRTIDGVEADVLMGDGVLWASRYPDIVDLIKDMFDNGIKLNTSSEYRYDEYDFDDDNVEIHDGNLYFEGIAVLGSDSNYVAPAYDSATLTMLNESQTNSFNLLVAQALKNEKGVEELTNTQLNKISYHQIMEEAKSQIAESLNGTYEYLWVSDITQEDVIVYTEDSDYNTKHYQYKYTITNDVVSVDLESKVEVKESREWNIVTNTLNEKVDELALKVNELTEGKTELVQKLNEANEVISQLNTQVEELTALNAELTPFKEQVELANKEAKVAEVKESFESKFNSVEGSEVFKTEEIQNLIINAIEDGEVGLNAKLALNEKVLELASSKLEKFKNPLEPMLNSNKSRDLANLITLKDEDPLADLR